MAAIPVHGSGQRNRRQMYCNLRKKRPGHACCWIVVTASAIGSFVLGHPSYAAQPAQGLIRFRLVDLDSTKQALATLDQPASFSWRGTPLREGLQNISRAYRLSIWLDRRIDPSLPITLPRVNPQSRDLHSVFQQVAKLAQCEIGLIENVLYVGPRGEVSRLQRAAIEFHNDWSIRKSADGRNATVQMRELSWEELTSPDELLQKVVAAWKVRTSIELPHDLLHAGSLQRPCTIATQLTVALGGFELEPTLGDGFTIEATELRKATDWKTIYLQVPWSVTTLKSTAAKHSGSYQRRGQGWAVDGDTNMHLALKRLQTNQRTPPQRGELRWSGDIKGPAKNVLEQFAQGQGISVTWDERLTTGPRNKFIQFTVDESSLSELLSAYGEACGFKVRLDEKNITVSPE